MMNPNKPNRILTTLTELWRRTFCAAYVLRNVMFSSWAASNPWLQCSDSNLFENEPGHCSEVTHTFMAVRESKRALLHGHALWTALPAVETAVWKC